MQALNSPLVQNLVNETLKQNEHILGPREADPSKAESFQAMLSEIALTRGRPLYYNYISNGKGRGPYVEMEDGSVKMDLINGIGINIMGHSQPQVLAASIAAATEDVVMQGNLQPNHLYIKLIKSLTDLAKKHTRLEQVWLSTCGSMANENALKAIRQKNSPRRKIIAMSDAFAGRTTMMAEITDNAEYRVGLPRYDEVYHIPFYDAKNPNSAKITLQKLEEILAKDADQICAFMFEPIQGEGGFKIAPKEFFLPLFALCKKHNIAIWADEVQTFLRTGEIFAVEKLGIAEHIDVLTIAKTLQCAATFWTKEYAPKPGLIAGTFASSTVSIAAGLEILKIFTEQGYLGENGIVANIQKTFCQELAKIAETSCKGLIQDFGGMGLMLAITAFDGDKNKIIDLCKQLYKNGIVAYYCGHGPYRIRFLLPAILSSADIQVATKIIEKSILELKA